MRYYSTWEPFLLLCNEQILLSAAPPASQPQTLSPVFRPQQLPAEIFFLQQITQARMNEDGSKENRYCKQGG